MDSLERKVIRENLPKLVDETRDLSNLKTQVFSRGLLSHSELNIIFNSSPDTADQLFKFYDVLPHKGPQAFDQLVESLNETTNKHVGEFLANTLKERKRKGENDVCEQPSPRRCKLPEPMLDSIADEDEDDEENTCTSTVECRLENGKIKAQSLLRKLLQSGHYTSSVVLKEISVLGRIADKVHLPNIKDYIWQNRKLEDPDEFDIDTLLFFYTNQQYQAFQFKDICSMRVNVEINFADEFVIASKQDCVKIGGNLLLDEIGKGGLRNIFSSIKCNKCLPKRVELIDVNISRCPFPLDSSFLIEELYMKNVSFEKHDILQKTIEICPELLKLEIINTEMQAKALDLSILQSKEDRKIKICLTNIKLQLEHCQMLSIAELELNSCSFPIDFENRLTQFSKLDKYTANNCTTY